MGSFMDKSHENFIDYTFLHKLTNGLIDKDNYSIISKVVLEGIKTKNKESLYKFRCVFKEFDSAIRVLVEEQTGEELVTGVGQKAEENFEFENLIRPIFLTLDTQDELLDDEYFARSKGPKEYFDYLSSKFGSPCVDSGELCVSMIELLPHMERKFMKIDTLDCWGEEYTEKELDAMIGNPNEERPKENDESDLEAAN